MAACYGPSLTVPPQAQVMVKRAWSETGPSDSTVPLLRFKRIVRPAFFTGNWRSPQSKKINLKRAWSETGPGDSTVPLLRFKRIVRSAFFTGNWRSPQSKKINP